ncbi:hypothetical protein cypCar_00008901, partial [Cyprinus carpio]
MHINVGAKQHTQSLKQLLHNINSNNEAVSELACWGLSISQEILVTQGRTLPSENICLHSASFVISPSVDWSREVVRDPSISTVSQYNQRARTQCRVFEQNHCESLAFNVRTISQPQKLHSIAQQILLQINCKLGGELWTVNVPL